MQIEDHINEQIVRAAPTLTEFNPISVVANTTYIVSGTSSVGTLTLPANVTLIFQGGRINGTTLTGNNTKIIAAITQIFDANLNVIGTWDIERAYPQWFGAKTYTVISTSMVNSAGAINRAITMKFSGEVFLTKGFWRIDNTINVRLGIQLVGEIAGGPRSEVPNTAGSIPFSTTLIPGYTVNNNGSLAGYTNGYLICVNTKPDGSSEYYKYNGTNSAVKNIFFYNHYQFPTGVVGIRNIKGILFAGQVEIDFCSWGRFKQAASGIFVYSDLRKITNCTFDYPDGSETSPVEYAFDLTSLGDGLLFQQNSVHNPDGHSSFKALRVNMCNGGTINANVLNSEVMIKNSKAVIFSANHLEGGSTQLIIDDSEVTSTNNYFIKGLLPSMHIKSSAQDSGVAYIPVVKSLNNMFVFYDNHKDQDPEEEYEINGINEFDVQIDGSCSFDISQTYRYRLISGQIEEMSPFGILVCRVNPDNPDDRIPVREFNDYSYLLSSQGRIMSDYHVINSAYSIKLLTPEAYANNGNMSNVKWKIATGNYYYKWQILWDRTRRIVGNSGTLFPYGSSPSSPFYLIENGGGVLFHLIGASNGQQVLLRLYRGPSSTSPNKYVDIPIIGAFNMYDNGISVAGFKWKTLTSDEDLMPTMPTTSIITNITSIRFMGENVECKAPAVPESGVGAWKEGDLIYNTNTNTDTMTAYWIFLNNAWRAK